MYHREQIPLYMTSFHDKKHRINQRKYTFIIFSQKKITEKTLYVIFFP